MKIYIVSVEYCVKYHKSGTRQTRIAHFMQLAMDGKKAVSEVEKTIAREKGKNSNLRSIATGTHIFFHARELDASTGYILTEVL